MDGLRQLHSSQVRNAVHHPCSLSASSTRTKYHASDEIGNDSASPNKVSEISQLQIITKTEQGPVIANLLSDVEVALFITPTDSQEPAIRPHLKGLNFDLSLFFKAHPSAP